MILPPDTCSRPIYVTTALPGFRETTVGGELFLPSLPDGDSRRRNLWIFPRNI